MTLSKTLIKTNVEIFVTNFLIENIRLFIIIIKDNKISMIRINAFIMFIIKFINFHILRYLQLTINHLLIKLKEKQEKLLLFHVKFLKLLIPLHFGLI